MIAKSQKKKSVTFQPTWELSRPPSTYRVTQKFWKFKRPYIAKRRALSNRIFVYSYFEKVCRKKCTRQSRKVLWVVLSSMFFKEIWMNGTRGHGRVCEGSNKSRFDGLHCQEQGVDHILYYLSGFSRAHFFRHAFNSGKQRCLAAVMPHKSNTRNNR